jgi:hypothetical protein
MGRVTGPSGSRLADQSFTARAFLHSQKFRTEGTGVSHGRILGVFGHIEGGMRPTPIAFSFLGNS